jgi:DNA-directed RNA polymerase subunit beta
MHANGQVLYSVRLIPDRGSWIEIQFDTNDIMWVYMDRRRRRRKFHATTFLRALGFGTDEQILKLFYSFPKTLDVRDSFRPRRSSRPSLQGRRHRRRLAGRARPPLRARLRARPQADGQGRASPPSTWSTSPGTRGCCSRRWWPIPRDRGGGPQRHLPPPAPRRPATARNAKQLIKRLFFDPRRYDLGLVGRYKINQKLKLGTGSPPTLRTLTRAAST